MTAAYFERLDEHRFHPTLHAGGAWQPEVELHMGPVSGLLLHEIERFLGSRGDALTISRISFDVLGQLHAADIEVGVEVIRPGRVIELVEATATIAGRAAVRARVWLLADHDTAAVAGGTPDALAAPDTLPAWSPSSVWGGGYIRSLDGRRAPSAEPGRATVWLRSDAAVVAGEASSELTRYVTLIDTANGVAIREPIEQWSFPSIDLVIHLYRRPVGPWVGLDVSVVFGANGQGVTSTGLYDVDGPVGRAEQMLIVRAVR